MTDISIIVPIFNGEKWIDSCMKSIASQCFRNIRPQLEIVVFNDGSNDRTDVLLFYWANYFRTCGKKIIVTGSPVSRGVGAAKNGAILKSTGKFLCFQDVDDVMHPDRISLQWEAAILNKNAIIGCRVSRIPVDSTPRFVNWANNLSASQLKSQIYTSHGPTVLMPTWFCHRSVFDRVGGFDESGQGTPEDLIFFYKHLDSGGDIQRVDDELVIYTYHEGAATFSVTREIIWEIQLDRLNNLVLPKWEHFTVWNAGKAGRKFVRSLNPKNLVKVVAFCDVDKNKIGRTIELYCPVKRKVTIKLPVVHFTVAKPPFIICVKLDLTDGQFETNLNSLNLTEGVDYIIYN